jgi:hypothetical protein
MMNRVFTVRARLALACGLAVLFGVGAATTEAQGRRQMQRAQRLYNQLNKQQVETTQKQFEASQKLAAQRQAQLAAEAQKNLEMRKAAADASRLAKDEKKAKLKESLAKDRAEVEKNEKAAAAKKTPAKVEPGKEKDSEDKPTKAAEAKPTGKPTTASDGK